MGKSLIAVISCNRDAMNGYNHAVRQTWLHNSSADYVFVIGGKSSTIRMGDELYITAKDDYLSLPNKTHGLLTWALNEGYDNIFKCDTDTYVKVNRILSSNFSDYDYIGYFNGEVGKPNVIYNKCYAWASGGSGYWLSRRAAEYIVSNPPDHKSICPQLNFPCEDLWVGQLLGPNIQSGSISGLHDPRYYRGYRDNYTVEFTSHYCSEGMNRRFDTGWLYKHHAVNVGT